MANQFYVLVTKQNRFIISEPRWIEDATIGCYTKVFHSPDNSKDADFGSAVRFYINFNIDACYEAFVIKRYNSRELAEKYTARMRPRFPVRNKGKSGNAVFGHFRFDKPKIVDNIYLDCETSDHDIVDPRSSDVVGRNQNQQQVPSTSDYSTTNKSVQSTSSRNASVASIPSHVIRSDRKNKKNASKVIIKSYYVSAGVNIHT